MEYCLIADIGGTNCRFFLYQVDLTNPENKTEIFEKSYHTNTYDNIYQVMDLFLDYKVCKENKIKFCVIAIAGPPIDNVIASLINIRWKGVDGNEISKKYGFGYCKLLNDFEAVGYAFYSYKLEKINLTKPAMTDVPELKNADNLMVLGYGTGLGVVSVRNYKNKDKYLVQPQEGAHLGLSPKSDEQWEIMQSVRSTHKIAEKQILSQEIFCCGVGAFAVFDFFHQKIYKRKYEKTISGKEVFEFKF